MIKTLILKWVAFWFLAMGSFIFLLKPLGISHKESTLISSIYFILIAIVGGYIFDVHKAIKRIKTTRILFFSVALSFILFILITPYLANYFPISQEMITYLNHKEFYYPLLTYKISTVKVFDILFQQVLIFALVSSLINIIGIQNFAAKKKVVIFFTLTFLCIHLPLIFVFGWMSFIFIIPSLFAGVVFSLCIINFNLGFLYSVLVHQAFYIISAIVLRAT